MTKDDRSSTAASSRLASRIAASRAFHRMMSRQGIDLDSVHWLESEGMTYRALHTCSRCAEKSACAAWIAGHEPSLDYRRFCPNAETIEALRIMAR